MAESVYESLQNNEVLIVEAGTGTGKTLAYLLALLHFSYTKKVRVAISTETKSLQDQIIKYELPIAQNILGTNLQTEICVGASNYVCKRRLQEVLNTGAFLPISNLNDESNMFIKEFLEWEKESNGLLTEYKNQLPYNFKNKISRDVNDCLASKCPNFDVSPYFVAKKSWQRAKVLVLNHSLLANHVALLKASDGKIKLLPEFEYLVIDEAHRFSEILQKAFSESIHINDLQFLLKNDFNLEIDNEKNKNQKLKVKDYPNKQLIKESDKTNNILSLKKELSNFFTDNFKKEIRITNSIESDITYEIINELEKVSVELEKKISNFNVQKQQELDLEVENLQLNEDQNLLEMQINSLYKRVLKHKDILERFVESKEEEVVLWISREKKSKNIPKKDFDKTKNLFDTFDYSINISPLDARKIAQDYFFTNFKSIILTSATLTGSKNKPFNYFKQELGFNDYNKEIEPVTLILDSPFNYKNNSILYIPSHITDPTLSFDNYHKDLAIEIHKLLQLSGGGAFVLFTSTNSLRSVQKILEDENTKNNSNYIIHSQISLTSNIALKEFKANKKKNSVLLGLATFWQGIDIQGSALRMVIMTRIPFRVPDEPVLAARMEFEKLREKDPFSSLQLPQAIIIIRQGYGRLIRSYTDTGVVAILDPRIKSKKYGNEILDTLPSSKRIFDFKNLEKAYKEL